MQVAYDAHGREPLAEQVGVGLVGVAGDDHASHFEAHGAEDVHEAQHVLIVGDAEVAAHLRALDVVGVDGDDDLHVVLHRLQHGDLRVRLEAGQHARGMVVVEELTAELEIELAAKLLDPLADTLGLQLDVLVVVESFAHGRHSFASVAFGLSASPRRRGLKGRTVRGSLANSQIIAQPPRSLRPVLPFSSFQEKMPVRP